MARDDFLDLCIVEVLRGKPYLVRLRLLKLFFSLNPERKSVFYIRLVQHLKKSGFGMLASWYRHRLASRFGIYVDPVSDIGVGLMLPHPTSIVIGRRISIGKRCRIYQQVTIGAAPTEAEGIVSRIGDDVTIYPGVKFVGRGRVGNRVIVGANAVVTDVFGDDVVLAGVPARVIRATHAGDRIGAVRRL